MKTTPIETAVPLLLPWTTGKIQPRHLERLAIVYVRQSTVQQLVRNQESTRLQYGLNERAVAIGWPADRILVIDDDLGLSGASADARPGFQRLVAEVGLDHVGLILGLEMSRLARSCKDWYQLLEVCAIFGTLIGDLDGIYDPSQYNDRLLLGLKGTMSEAELHILKQRMHQGRLAKARRGELGMRSPIGYWRRPSGEVILDRDEQAQSVVRLVFEQFERLGTLGSLLRYLAAHDIRLPFRCPSGLSKGELEWRRPNRPTLQNMLHNPAYAGAYVYGRRPTDPRRKMAGRSSSGRLVAKPETWEVCLRNRIPAYLTWEQFEANVARLAANRNRADAQGVVRHGPALLGGLLWCGRCGNRMLVQYGGRANHGRYQCFRDRMDYGAPLCQGLTASHLDDLVSQKALEALQPAALEIALRVAEDMEAERARLEEHWRQKRERVHYETERARRQYDAVEPENRLVARTLEKTWEERMAAEQQVEEEYRRFSAKQPRFLTPAEHEQIQKLSADIPALWHAQATTPADRREILRQIIERVVVSVKGSSEQIQVTIEWAGGHRSNFMAWRPVAKLEQLSYWSQLLDRVAMLRSSGSTASQIAEALNKEGWRPPKRTLVFNRGMVRALLSRRRLSPTRRSAQSQKRLKKHEWWLPELASHLQMPEVTLYTWVRRGWLHARQLDGKQGRWILWADSNELERFKRLRARKPQQWTDEQPPDAKPPARPPGW